MRRFSFAVVMLVALCGQFVPLARGQATQPTTRPRYTVTPPPGFVMVSQAGQRILCEPADQAWVTQALGALAPATRPTTMPADLLTRFNEKRPQIVAMMAKDGAVEDVSAINKDLDEHLVPELKQLRDFKPPTVFIAITEGKLKSILRDNQWSTPAFRYNRIADTVLRAEPPPLVADREMDDMLFPAIYTEADTPELRSADLQSTIRKQDLALAEAISGHAMFSTQLAFVNAFHSAVFQKLNLPADQQWLAIGVSGVLSADYACQVSGADRKELIYLLAVQMRNNPVSNRSIDLLHPAEPSTLKRQYVVPYTDAYRHKSMYVANAMLDKARAKLPVMIAALREKPCTSGEELVKRIKEVMDVDVSALVGAR